MKKAIRVISFFIIVAMTITLLQFSQAGTSLASNDKGQRLENAIVLYIGSSQALVNNEEIQVDTSNPEVRPVIKNGRTLVPVRFIAEKLGAKVGWDAGKSQVEVTLGGKTVKLTLGSSSMTSGNAEVTLEAPAESINGRTFIPLRPLVEALGKKVFYDKGLVVISDMESILDTNLDKAMIDDTISKVNRLPILGSYDNFKSLMGITYGEYTKEKQWLERNILTGISSQAPQAAEAASPPQQNEKATTTVSDSKSVGAGQGDYSTTNTQVQGVDEADIVKTDGEYIYQVNNQRIIVAKAYPAENMEIKSVLGFADASFSPQEMYLNGDKLVVIGTTYNSIPVLKADTKDEKMPPVSQYYSRNTVKAVIYDITDKSNIKQLREVELEGSYVSSRKIGSALYLVANRYMDYYALYEQSDNITPCYRDTAVKNEFVNIDYTEIRYFPGPVKYSYMVIAGLNLDKDSEAAKISTYLGSSENIYVSQQNLYVAVTEYRYNEAQNKPMQSKEASGASMPALRPRIGIVAPTGDNSTLIYKFSLNDGQITYLCKGEVPGTILNQFSMDENNEYFRIATTLGEAWRTDQYTSQNNVYVLDEMLDITGKIENMAPGEKIYSVRFMGDRGYVVTFKTVDPLFVIDLKDAYKPAILGALKIPGYSDYLHPYDENHIIGFGKDAVQVSYKDSNGKEVGNAAYYTGMKLAVFDVTDVSKPVEMFSEKIGDRGTDSELLRNHKALLFSKEKNLLAFPITVMEVKNEQAGQDTSSQYGEFTFQGAYVYSLDLKSGFTLRGKITHLSSDDYLKSGNYSSDGSKYIQRILYIGDTLYTLSNGMIKANGLADMGEKKSLMIP